MRIYDFSDYKAYLKALIEKKSKKSHGYKAELARAANCPQSLISQVLHTKVHLSPDHGLALTTHWGFTSDERDYFLHLIQLSRASTREMRAYLEERLKEIRLRNEDLSTRFRQPRIENSQQEWSYFTNWIFASVHMLLTVPGFQKPHAIAQRLNVPQQLVENVLNALAQMQLVKEPLKDQEEKWFATQASIHLSKHSPASAVNHFIWRQRAMDDVYRGDERSVHYTTLHTLSVEDAKRMRALLLECIEKTRKIAAPSKEETLIAFSCDWFYL